MADIEAFKAFYQEVPVLVGSLDSGQRVGTCDMWSEIFSDSFYGVQYAQNLLYGDMHHHISLCIAWKSS